MPQPVPGLDLRALGWRIKELRVERGWTIEKLAEEADLGRRTILTLEAGAKSPNVNTLHAVAWALGIPLAILIEPLNSKDDRRHRA